MSDVNMIKPPAIAVRAEASSSRVLGRAPDPKAKQMTDVPDVKPARPTSAGQQKRIGQFGAPTGVSISRRGEAPVTRLAPQTLSVLTSTLTSLRKLCKANGNAAAEAHVAGTLAMVGMIARGEDVSVPDDPLAAASSQVAAMTSELSQMAGQLAQADAEIATLQAQLVAAQKTAAPAQGEQK